MQRIYRIEALINERIQRTYIIEARIIFGHTGEKSYKGRAYSSIAAKSLREFVDQMANINLPYPKKLDVALPANLKCLNGG